MSKQFEETEYKALTKNVTFFKRTQKLYNAVLDSEYNEMIAEASNIAHRTIAFINMLRINEVVSANMKKIKVALYVAYLMVIRTIVLQVTDEKPASENIVGYDLETLANYAKSKAFRHWTQTYESGDALLAAYCLLLNAKRDDSSVRQAFREVNGYLREFFENEGGHESKEYMREEELTRAVHKLPTVCIENTEDEDSREETLLQFSFEKMYEYLCMDMVYLSVQHMKMKNFFNMCGCFNV